MNEIQLSNNFTQKEFDTALSQLKDVVINDLADAVIIVDQIVLVDGYIDIAVLDGDNGELEYHHDHPHFWYNKYELDKRNIKY